MDTVFFLNSLTAEESDLTSIARNCFFQYLTTIVALNNFI